MAEAPPTAQEAPPPNEEAQPPADQTATPTTNEKGEDQKAQAPTVVVIVGAVYSPVNMHCPYCNKEVTTHVAYEIGSLTWLLFALMFIFGFWLFCWIPFVVNCSKDVVHRCPHCKQVIARHNRIS